MNNVSRSNKLKPQLSRHCLGTVITKNPQKLYDSDNFIIKIQEILDTYDVQCIGKLKHDFSNKSFTCLIGLAESHISVHTWPEKFAVQLLLLDRYRQISEPPHISLQSLAPEQQAGGLL
jgi:S-adenosylmethionine/arginine decarboxylase-like enzyme